MNIRDFFCLAILKKLFATFFLLSSFLTVPSFGQNTGNGYKVYAANDQSSMSCEEAKRKVSTDDYENLDDCNEANKKHAQCNARKFPADDPVVVAVEYPDQPGRFFFGLIHHKDAANASLLAKAIIRLVPFTIGLSEEDMKIITVAGDYTVDAYHAALKRDDPLLILSPTVIPGNQLANDALKKFLPEAKRAVKKVDKATSSDAATITAPLLRPDKTVKKIGKKLKKIF